MDQPLPPSMVHGMADLVIVVRLESEAPGGNGAAATSGPVTGDGCRSICANGAHLASWFGPGGEAGIPHSGQRSVVARRS